MSRLLMKGNLAVFEYPSGAENPSFSLVDGVLWIEGYSLPFHPKGTPIRSMKRYDINLKDYSIIGHYRDAVQKIQGNFSELTEEVDTENCIVLVKNTE